MSNEDLRNRAEEIFQKANDDAEDYCDSTTNKELFHELKVHQIELEIQNEELRNSEINLTDLKNKYFSLFETAPVGYVVLSEENEIQEANLTFCEMVGYSKEYILNSKFTSFISPTAQDNFYFFRDKVINNRMSVPLELEIIKSDGNIITVNINPGVLGDGDTNILLALTDISKQKDLESKLIKEKERAEASDKTKSRFLATMSHELRTPLNTVIGTSDIILRKNISKEIKKDASIIKKSAEHLLMIISDILDYSHIEEGSLTLNPVDFNLEDVFVDCYDIMQLNFLEKGIDFKKSFPDLEKKYFYGDSKRISQIIINILSNALKYTNEGEVTFSYDLKPENILTIIVKDTGVGIAPGKLQLIFDGFKQVDTSFMRKTGGSGLGLSIVKNLVHSMDGKVDVESKFGEGTEFKISIPLKESEKGDLQLGESESLDEKPNLRILLADDNRINAKMGSALLKSDTRNVDIASNGAEAVELVQKNEYDVVLLDIEMPVMDGIEAAEKIRSLKENSDMKVYALTAHMASSIQDQIREGLFDDIIEKPINIKKLEKYFK